MLGSVGSPSHWQWAAAGKHPAVNDFFQLGSDLPLMDTFLGWLRRGYSIVASREQNTSSYYSWRFWCRGTKSDSLACGLVRDSSDGLGRPYPLLVLGHGPLKGWEDHWDLLVLASEGTWNRMEYLSKRLFNNLREFEKELVRVSPPEPDWEGSNREKEGLWSPPFPDEQHMLNGAIMEEALKEIEGKDSFFIDLNQVPPEDQFRLVSAYHFSMKRHLKSIPNTQMG